MPITRVCHITQKEVFSSEEYLEDLNNLEAESAADLEEDLNYIRTVLKLIGGGTHWYNPNINEGLEQLLDDFKVEHYTTSEDPTKAGQHKDIHADSITSYGDGDFRHNLFVQRDIYLRGLATDNGFIIHSRSATDYDFLHIAPRSSGVNEWDKGLIVFRASGNTRVLQTLEFTKPETSGTEIIDFGGGFSLYRDNVSPVSSSISGHRLWIDGPNSTTGTNETGVVIGPRASSSIFEAIRFRAKRTRVEGGHLEVYNGTTYSRGGFVFGHTSSGNPTSHLDHDGALYRYSGEVYLTVDNYFFIRDAGVGAKFHFVTDTGRLGVNKTYPNCELDVNGDACISGTLTYSSLVPGNYRKYTRSRADGLATIQKNLIFLKTPYKVEEWNGSTWVDVTTPYASQLLSVTALTGVFTITGLTTGESKRLRIYYDAGESIWSGGVFRVSTQHTNEVTFTVEASTVSDFSSNVASIGPYTDTSAWDAAFEIPTKNRDFWARRYFRFDIELKKTSSTHEPKIRELAFFAEASVSSYLNQRWPIYAWNNQGQMLNKISGTDANPSYSWKNDQDTGILNPAGGVIGFTSNGSRRMSVRNEGVAISNTSAAFVPSEALHVLENVRVDQVTKTNVLSVSDFNRTSHYERDGSIYRYNGQVYLTVDDNFYIRDAWSSTKFHFDTNTGELGVNKTSPSYNLDVNGNAAVSDTLTVGTDFIGDEGTRHSGNIYVAGEYHGINRSGTVLLQGDWRKLVYETVNVTSLEYDPTTDVVKIRGRNSWVKIRLRLPTGFNVYGLIAEAKAYTLSGGSPTGRFYIGAISLDENFNELATDNKNAHNYFGAVYYPLSNTGFDRFVGAIGGYNEASPSTNSSLYRFDPGAKYFDLVIVANYNADSEEITEIKGITIKNVASVIKYTLPANYSLDRSLIQAAPASPPSNYIDGYRYIYSVALSTSDPQYVQGNIYIIDLITGNTLGVLDVYDSNQTIIVSATTPFASEAASPVDLVLYYNSSVQRSLIGIKLDKLFNPSIAVYIPYSLYNPSSIEPYYPSLGVVGTPPTGVSNYWLYKAPGAEYYFKNDTSEGVYTLDTGIECATTAIHNIVPFVINEALSNLADWIPQFSDRDDAYCSGGTYKIDVYMQHGYNASTVPVWLGVRFLKTTLLAIDK